MNIQDYLQWLEDNCQTAAKFYNGWLVFSLSLDVVKQGMEWTAGYSCIEEYDGQYLLRNIGEQNAHLLVALAESYQKTAPVIEKLQMVKRELQGVGHIEIGKKYTVIELASNGRVRLIEVTGKSETRPCGFLFVSEASGRELVYRPYQYKFIFPRLSPEMKAQLEGDD